MKVCRRRNCVGKEETFLRGATMVQQAAQQQVEAFFTVRNRKGMHTRPSTELVKCAAGFKSQLRLRYQKTTVNAKSLLGILMLAIPHGARVWVEAEGPDAEEALAALTALAAAQFHMHY
jgi:phosphocarrier protein HPr